MARKYKRKTQTNYSNNDVKEALKEIKDKKCSIRSTAKKYNIPFDTLRRWVVNPPSHAGSGRNTFLTQLEEQCLVRAMQFTASCGYPFDRADLVKMVQSYLEFSGKPNPFPNSTPGPDWLRNFECRWEKELGKRKPDILTKSRAKGLSKEVIDEFFTMYENLLSEHNLRDQPHRIFNADETGLSTNPLSSKVYVEKKARNSYMECATGGKTMYTVLFCVSATGQYMPPFTVYKGKNLYDTWIKGGPDGATYAVTPSGWMQDDVFEKWIEHFIDSVKKMKLTLPVLLLFDGHGSHLTYGTVKKALDNQVIILCLPPNTSHALQPLDVGVFRPLKLRWKKILKNWYRESRMQSVGKAVFPSLLNKLFQELRSENGVGGFKGSGLFPPKKDIVYKRMLKNHAPAPIPIIEAVASTSAITTNQNVKQCSSLQDESSIGSPFKHIKAAVLETLSPTPSIASKEAMKNVKRKRTRMQQEGGEILTTSISLERLHTEKVRRENKYAKNSARKERRNETIACEENTLSPKDFDNVDSLQVGKWVQVEFLGKKSKKLFHGIIVSQNEDSYYTVKFAREQGSSFFIFPEKDDISEVDVSQIVKVLPHPEMTPRGLYYFL